MSCKNVPVKNIRNWQRVFEIAKISRKSWLFSVLHMNCFYRSFVE